MKNTFIITDNIPHVNEQICRLFNNSNLNTDNAGHYIYTSHLMWGEETDTTILKDLSDSMYNNAPVIHYTELPMFKPKLKRI